MTDAEKIKAMREVVESLGEEYNAHYEVSAAMHGMTSDQAIRFGQRAYVCGEILSEFDKIEGKG